MQSLPACGLVDLKGKLMVFSIYAVSYERYSAALYGAARAAPIKMSVTFSAHYYSARTKESGRGTALPLCHRPVPRRLK